MTNEEKVKRLEKRRVLLTLIILFGISTIVLSILSLVVELNPIFAVISFTVEAILSNYRNKLDSNYVKEEKKDKKKKK